jgi:hypothetical protein
MKRKRTVAARDPDEGTPEEAQTQNRKTAEVAWSTTASQIRTDELKEAWPADPHTLTLTQIQTKATVSVLNLSNP